MLLVPGATPGRKKQCWGGSDQNSGRVNSLQVQLNDTWFIQALANIYVCIYVLPGIILSNSFTTP